DGSFVPEGDICSAAKLRLFDHLVGEREQLRWYFQAERFGGLEIDDQLDLGGLQDRQVRRPLALENPTCVETDLTVLLFQAEAVAHKSTGGGELAVWVQRGNGMACGKCNKLLDPAVEKKLISDDERPDS